MDSALSTRIFVSLEIPDVELSLEDIAWDKETPPNADDVIEMMKSSVFMERMMSEWGLDGVQKVSVQVAEIPDDRPNRPKHSFATWTTEHANA